jgi:hypothetical protein
MEHLDVLGTWRAWPLRLALPVTRATPLLMGPTGRPAPDASLASPT